MVDGFALTLDHLILIVFEHALELTPTDSWAAKSITYLTGFDVIEFRFGSSSPVRAGDVSLSLVLLHYII
jgi:hypothetical protein